MSYYEQHKEVIKKQSREYYYKHRDKYLEYNREYFKKYYPLNVQTIKDQCRHSSDEYKEKRL